MAVQKIGRWEALLPATENGSAMALSWRRDNEGSKRKVEIRVRGERGLKVGLGEREVV